MRLSASRIAYFTELGRGFEWKVYDYDTPPHLEERLSHHGFEVEEAEAVMVLNLDTAPSRLFQPIQQDIRRIGKRAELEDVRKVEEAVWNEDMAGLITYLGDTAD